MSDTIPPALTPEEWTDAQNQGVIAAGLDAIEDALYSGGDARATAAHRGAALLIAALPDGDPRKLTRDDVAACRAFDFQFYGAESDSVLIARADCDALQRLATKLAALLPPEGA